MGMEMTPEQVAIELLQGDVAEIRKDLTHVSEFIRGNGDPTKGLLWLVADLGRLVAAQAEMIGNQAKAFEQHKTDGHYTRSSVWTRLAYDAGKQLVVLVVTAAVFLIVLGALGYIRAGSRP